MLEFEDGTPATAAQMAKVKWAFFERQTLVGADLVSCKKGRDAFSFLDCRARTRRAQKVWDEEFCRRVAHGARLLVLEETAVERHQEPQDQVFLNSGEGREKN
jgi:hypothetical protein